MLVRITYLLCTWQSITGVDFDLFHIIEKTRKEIAAFYDT